MSERENYRETAVAGTDLLLKSWSEGTRIQTVISWPPHGIERPIVVTLTLSDDEVDILAAGFRGYAPGHDDETALLGKIGALMTRICHAVIVQCALLREMQELDPRMTIVAPWTEPSP